MTFKEEKIEALAKRYSVEEGLNCKPELKCSECSLFSVCQCPRFAKMTIDFGYEKKEETERETAKMILSRLKSQMYYPDLPEGSHLVSQKVVDEDDIEKEIGILIATK